MCCDIPHSAELFLGLRWPVQPDQGERATRPAFEGQRMLRTVDTRSDTRDSPVLALILRVTLQLTEGISVGRARR